MINSTRFFSWRWLALLPILTSCSLDREVVRPSSGFVPDAATAIRIAEAVWTPIYGATQVHSERPFHAELRGELWHVYGSLPQPPRGMEMVGGVMEADINRRNGKILQVLHGE